jgi:hypothetical protein
MAMKTTKRPVKRSGIKSPPLSKPWSELTQEEREARVSAVQGMFKDVLSSVDEFLAQKQEEIDLEEERFQRRLRGE